MYLSHTIYNVNDQATMNFENEVIPPFILIILHEQ